MEIEILNINDLSHYINEKAIHEQTGKFFDQIKAEKTNG